MFIQSSAILTEENVSTNTVKHGDFEHQGDFESFKICSIIFDHK